jgi:hypothetical protein
VHRVVGVGTRVWVCAWMGWGGVGWGSGGCQGKVRTSPKSPTYAAVPCTALEASLPLASVLAAGEVMYTRSSTASRGGDQS